MSSDKSGSIDGLSNAGAADGGEGYGGSGGGNVNEPAALML